MADSDDSRCRQCGKPITYDTVELKPRLGDKLPRYEQVRRCLNADCRSNDPALRSRLSGAPKP